MYVKLPDEWYRSIIVSDEKNPELENGNLVWSRMATKMERRKQVRFENDLQTFNYSFPCHVCDFETARKRELEQHLFSVHSIEVSFTHASSFRRKPDKRVDSIPQMLLIGLGVGLYFSSYAWLLLTFCKTGKSAEQWTANFR